MTNIPDDIVGPERTLLHMFKLFVEPEVDRRKSRNSLPDSFSIIAVQVLFFEGRSPEVRLNDEVQVSFLVKVPRALKEGEQLSLSQIEKIKASELKLADADAGHFTAVAFNNHWHMSFDFRKNKLKASNLVKRAEEFCNVAEHALSQQHFGPAIDNLFSACELAAKARLIISSVVSSDVKTTVRFTQGSIDGAGWATLIVSLSKCSTDCREIETLHVTLRVMTSRGSSAPT